jgi:hypothetical protein
MPPKGVLLAYRSKNRPFPGIRLMEGNNKTYPSRSAPMTNILKYGLIAAGAAALGLVGYKVGKNKGKKEAPVTTVAA